MALDWEAAERELEEEEKRLREEEELLELQTRSRVGARLHREEEEDELDKEAERLEEMERVLARMAEIKGYKEKTTPSMPRNYDSININYKTSPQKTSDKGTTADISAKKAQRWKSMDEGEARRRLSLFKKGSGSSLASSTASAGVIPKTTKSSQSEGSIPDKDNQQTTSFKNLLDVALFSSRPVFPRELWFFGKISRDEAEQLLMAEQSKKTFLIRTSSQAGCFALSKFDPIAQVLLHLLIESVPTGGFHLQDCHDKKIYISLDELVNTSPITLGYYPATKPQQ